MLMQAALVVVLMFVFSSSHADVLILGLKTHHFSSPSDYDKCRTESHDLAALARGGYVVGTYTNSHCRRSFLAGGSYAWGHGLGVDVVAVNNYPSKLHLVAGLVIIPQVTYSKFWQGYGVKLSFVPGVLVGAGFVYQLN